jgi:hypothetical protein
VVRGVTDEEKDALNAHYNAIKIANSYAGDARKK